MEYISFNLGDEEFGISVHEVREVLEVPPIISLPGMPKFIEGVITLRKHSIAIIAMRKRLEIPTKEKECTKHVIVVRLEGLIMGLLVDRVNDIVKISEQQIDSAADVVGSYLGGKAITGIAHLDERIIIILDLINILSPKERSELKKARS